ncbi:MAG: hypothetical protein ACRDFB_06920, partial [Rhabdochlamydiaceae bacterium]
EDKAYLIKGKALETVFAKRSTPENQLSFRLLKKSDEIRIYYMVEIRSKKSLENCTAKVIPITGREKQNEMVEYDTSWDGRLNMSTIDINPDEPAYAHLVTIPRGDSRMDHDKLLWEKCQQTSDQIKKSSLENQINFYASLPEHTRWPTCHLVGHANTMENFSVPS